MHVAFKVASLAFLDKCWFDHLIQILWVPHKYLLGSLKSIKDHFSGRVLDLLKSREVAKTLKSFIVEVDSGLPEWTYARKG